MTYLDTHIVVWLYQGSRRRLSREAAREIDRASSLLVSPAVELELEYLHRRTRSPEPSLILEDLRARIGMMICDLPFPLVAREARAIVWTDDVFDRLIVAQASSSESRLVTADGRILERYPLAIW